MKLRKRDLFLLVAAPAMLLGTVGILGGVNASLAPTEVQANYDATTKKDTFDFAFTEIGDTEWGTSYSDHSVSSTIATVSLGKTSKQASSSAIPNYPVASGVKGSYVTYSLNDDYKTLYTISSVSLVCRQWNSVTQTITLNLPNDSGVFEATDITSDDFTLSADNLSTSAVKFTFNASNKQIGIEALTVTLTTTETVKKTVTIITNCEQTIDPFEVDEGSKISSIEGADSLSKKGYHLDGWTTDKKWRNKWHFDTDVVTEDVTLYADWVKDNAAEFTLTFDTNKGSAAPAAQTVKEEHYFSTVEDPTKESDDLYSYTFAGWYEKDNDNNYLAEPFNFDTPATKDVELYAKWDSTWAIESETFFADNATEANLAFSYTATTEKAEDSSVTINPTNWGDASTTKVDTSLATVTWGGAKNTNDSDMRVYASKSITVTSKAGKLKSVVFTCSGNGDSSYGPSKLSLTSGHGSYTTSGKVGTWTADNDSNLTITLSASAQCRIKQMVITIEGGSTTTYSNFENTKLQFHYNLDSFENSQKSKIKKANEIGLIVTDDSEFDFSNHPTSLSAHEGKILKTYKNDYENGKGTEFSLSVGIAIPTDKYDVSLYAACYVLMPNGKYYFNTPKHYSVNSIIKEYAFGNRLTDATQKAICIAFAASLGLQQNS